MKDEKKPAAVSQQRTTCAFSMRQRDSQPAFDAGERQYDLSTRELQIKSLALSPQRISASEDRLSEVPSDAPPEVGAWGATFTVLKNGRS
jgi:hypothetical protein